MRLIFKGTIALLLFSALFSCKSYYTSIKKEVPAEAKLALGLAGGQSVPAKRIFAKPK